MKNTCKKILGVLIAIILLLNANIVFAVTQSDINNQKQQQQENNNKQKELEQQKDEVEAEKKETLKEVDKLNTQIVDYESQIASLESQIKDANAKIEEATTQLQQKEEDYKVQQEKFQQRMVAMYEAGDTSYLDFILTSQSLTDFISNYYLVSEISEHDTEMLEQIQEQKEAIEKTKKEIESSKHELTTAKATKEGVSTQLKSAKAEKNAKVAELSEEEKEIQNKISELQQANVAINAKIQSMQAALKKAQEEEEKKQSASGGSASGSSNGSPSVAGFIKPVNSYITTGLYYSSGSYHGAVDYGASGINGAPVYAVADGIVVTTQALTTSYGNYIIIYHPSSNLYTLYAHGQAGSIRVSELQYVKQGQQIMNVGSTGNSSGPHLHFEVRKAPGLYSNRVDPRAYLP